MACYGWTCSGGIGLHARLVSPAKLLSEDDSDWASCRFHERTVFDMERGRVAPGNSRSSIAHDPHGEASAVDGRGSSFDSLGIAGAAAALRHTEVAGSRSFAAQPGSQMGWTPT